MSAGGSADSKGEEMEKINQTSDSKISKEPIQSEAKENVNMKPELNLRKEFPLDKTKDMPEIKKTGKPMVGLPPINVNELTTILQDPAMPSQDLMKEIAQKIKIRNEENESKATSVNKVNPLGIRSVFDCIMEVTLSHADNSSDEEGDEHEPHILEIPCDYCKKIFGSTMSLKTHVLMSHSQDDPSVLNVRLRTSIDDDKVIQQSAKKDENLRKDAKSGNEKHGEAGVKRKQRKPSGGIGKEVTSHSLAKSTLDDGKKQGLTSELSDSDKLLTSSSSTALELTSLNSPSNIRSSLRKRKHSTDLIYAAMEDSKSQPSSSSLPQSTASPAASGKRKSDSTLSSPATKKGKRSRKNRSGDCEAAVVKESVQVRKSSRRK